MTTQTHLKNKEPRLTTEEYIDDIIAIQELRKREIDLISKEKSKDCEEKGKFCGINCLECLSKKLKGAKNEDQ